MHPFLPAPTPLLAIRDLAVSFAPSRTGADRRVQAVDGVQMTIYPRQVLAVVGESGCGKSVTALSLLRLLPRHSARFDRGSAVFQSRRGPRDLLSIPDDDLRSIRGGEIAMIFQEPMSSLNPVFSIGDQIVEAIRLHRPGELGSASRAGKEAKLLAIEAMRSVGIAEPEKRLNAFPHQFSGGMRQRVMIAMALACRPVLLLADEPTTALDATVQQQILGLLHDLRSNAAGLGSSGLAIMLITHDLGIVSEHADVVCVMYAGRVVEYATARELFTNPLHPYTRGLLACIPRVHERRERLATIAEVIEQEGAFAPPPGTAPDVRPWWPHHAFPGGASPALEPASDYVLYEPKPDHWIGAWRTESLRTTSPRPPDLRHHEDQSVGQAAAPAA